jgi:hypothetical protein
MRPALLKAAGTAAFIHPVLTPTLDYLFSPNPAKESKSGDSHRSQKLRN